METTTLFDSPQVEVVDPEDRAVANRDPEGGSVAVLKSDSLHRIAADGEAGIEFFERLTTLLSRARRAVIAMTKPRDWVLSKDKSGAIVGYLASTGAPQVCQLFAISYEVYPRTSDGRYAPEKVHREGDARVYGYRCWCRASSALLGGRTVEVEATRWSDEQFTGRATTAEGVIDTRRGDRALDSDLRLATHSLAVAKAVRELTGLEGVSGEELTEAGIKLEHCRAGQGFGSSVERDAGRVTTEDVKAAAKALGDEILSRVGGDQSAAADLLKDVTKGPNFAGFNSVGRLTKDWQIENAWKGLRSHPVFGDQASDAGEGG